MKSTKVRKGKVLSVEDLKENLHYDPLTGIFTRIISNSPRVKVGDIAGTLYRGYISISVSGKIYQAHRLAWLYMTGEMPEHCIDHINGVKTDNRINNLRQATHQQNNQNQIAAQKHNTTGFLGVTLNRRTGKYVAQISIKGKKKNIGYFVTAMLAHEAYLIVKRKYHEFCTI